jgi:hypothetical protein
MFKPKTTIAGRLDISSGAWIRLLCWVSQGTKDLRVMSQNLESVPFVQRFLQINQTDERWSQSILQRILAYPAHSNS